MKHLESALHQENQGWKYFLVFFVALFLGQSLGAIPLFIAMAIGMTKNGGNFEMPENIADFSAYGIDPNLGLALMVIPFIVSLLIAVQLIKGFHRRSFMEVINGGGAFRWNRFWKGFAMWAFFSAILLALALLFDPGNFEFKFHLSSFVPLVLVSVLLIPFQAGTEEFLFRGYLAQGVGAWTRNRLPVILLPALVFALTHGLNPEVKEFGFWETMPGYLLIGILLGVLSVLDDGIEMAIGAHSANNIFASLFITSKSSVLQTPALFTQKEVDPGREFWGLLVVSILFVLVVSYKSRWDFKLLFEAIQKKEQSMQETA